MNTAIASFLTPEASAEAALRDALLESRQRWRDLVSMAGDMAFETDADVHFAFIAPETVVGWATNTLIGQPAELLLAKVDGNSAFNPFRPTGPVRNRRAWLRRPDGRSVCMAFSAAPLYDAQGEVVGARGVGQDMSAQDAHDAVIAASLRRVELLDHILWRMRQEVLAPRMMRAALESLMTALGTEGCAVIDMIGDGVQATVLHQMGTRFASVRETVLALLKTGTTEAVDGTGPEGHLVLVCPSRWRQGEQTGFALWRRPEGQPWDAEELMLAGSATGFIRVILEHDGSSARWRVRRAPIR
jgi:hypothetical protein